MKKFTCLFLVSLFLLLSLVSIASCGQPSTPTTPTSPSENLTQAPSENVTPTLPATGTQTAPPTSTPTPATDTTPPSAITGLVAANAYDGSVNLRWDKSTAEDFDHYNIYINEAEMADVTGMEPIQQIKGVNAFKYQVTGLEDGTKYYIAVTAVDKSSNENMQVASASATPTPMPRGTVDPNLAVDVYQSDRAWAGTTLLADNHNSNKRRIIEVNMLGEVVWEYVVGETAWVETELLSNNNILYTVTGNGVYEVDRSGKIVWSYLTSKIDHDADRLPNGNTIFVFGMNDQKSDAQVTEVNPKGEVVWSWYAKDHFDIPPYDSIYNEGWTHVNAVSRLENGNTLISLRNFNFVVEVDPTGEVVDTYGEGIFIEQHDPEILANGNILVANHDQPHQAIEFDPKTGKIVWKSVGFKPEASPVRDANRLPNGNTLITGTTEIVEVTPKNEIVWQLSLKGVSFSQQETPDLGFYKADRIYQSK